MITIIIIAITCLVSYLCFNNEKLFSRLAFHPISVRDKNQFDRFITSGFVHGDMMHLLFNMYVFYMFGQYVEQMFQIEFGNLGRLLFIALYVGGLIISDMPSYFKHKDNFGYRSVGASGAVAAVLFCFILMNPTAPLQFIFIPIDIPAWIIGIGYLAYEYYAGTKAKGRINHNAHVSGALFGIVFTYILFPDVFSRFISLVIG